MVNDADDLLPVKSESWIKRYVSALGSGLTPEAAADATRKSVRTFLQAALPLLVAAGTALISIALWQAVLLAGAAAVLSFWQNALGK